MKYVLEQAQQDLAVSVSNLMLQFGYNSSCSGFPRLLGLMSAYEDGSLFLLVDAFSDTNTNGRC